MQKKTITLSKVLLYSVGIIVILAVAGVLLFNPLNKFLSKTEKVDANILIVEGWLPPSAIKKACEEFKSNSYDYIITTGLKSRFEGCGMYMSGYLIFYPTEILRTQDHDTKHTIEVSAFSELAGENAAEMNVFVDGTQCGHFITDTREKYYSVDWSGKLSDIDSVTIEFPNDKRGDFGDRNLYVRELRIDNKITIPVLGNSAYDKGKADGKNKTFNNVDSNAGSAREDLISMGIDSSVIISTPARRVEKNRTLTSALAARDWINTSSVKITGINIISSGTHSRRTWMTYNKVLNSPYKIGVVALPDYANKKGSRKIYKTLREAIGLVYYWFILLPY